MLFCSNIFSYDGVLWRMLEPTKKLDMMVLDDFEERVRWKPGNSLSIPSLLRYVYNSPLERSLSNYGNEKTEKLYQQELDILDRSAKIQGRTFHKSQNISQEIFMNFSNPGVDYQVIEPPPHERYFIKGRPIAFSIWVFGKGKKHTLYALFSNRVREKIPLKIGNLQFYGWKRLEVTIPVYVPHRNRLNHNVYEFRFDGLKIMSNPNEQPGNFSFLCDLISVMIERTPVDYPGSQIDDHWTR